jgi:hypothetical protein
LKVFFRSISALSASLREKIACFPPGAIDMDAQQHICGHGAAIN